MTESHVLSRYLDAVRRAEKERASGRASRLFVTVSRQAGAGGRTFAESLLRAMARSRDPLFAGWEVFDRKLCEAVAGDPSLRVSLESLLDETFRGATEDYLSQLLDRQSPQVKVERKVLETVRSLAEKGGAVIVGRGGHLVARDLPGGVHVRLVGSLERRVGRIAARELLPEAEARALAARRDRDRARFVRAYFALDVEDPRLYDLTINTDAVSFAHAAEAVLALLRARARSAARRHGNALR